MEKGETFEEAVRRELWEEVGLKDFTLGPWVWHRFHTFRFSDHMIAAEEKYFLVKTGRIPVSPAHPELEGVPLVRHKWWRYSEIAKAQSEVFVPRQLGALLFDVMNNANASYPVTVGK